MMVMTKMKLVHLYRPDHYRQTVVVVVVFLAEEEQHLFPHQQGPEYLHTTTN